ncbi:MAG: hypothetical protein AMXMBFR12_00630 [Candidatus Babeliales bacterium]
MNRIFLLVLVALHIPSKGMETPKLTIMGQRTGNIDTRCQTTADLMRGALPLAHIAYTLNGAKGIRPLICAVGPIAYQNEIFLARITELVITKPETSSWALLAFAVKNLKELHEKQNKTDIKNHTLYIDAIINPGSYEQSAFETFGFKKVGNYFATGKEQHIYLLGSDEHEGVNSRWQNFLLPFASIILEEKQHQEEDLQTLLDEQGKRTRSDKPSKQKSTPSHFPIIDPSQLPTPIPAAADPVYSAYPRLTQNAAQLESKIHKSHTKKKKKKHSKRKLHE